MCVHCLREAFPERHRCTLERGTYFLNFAGCYQCKQRNDFPIETSRTTKEEKSEEEMEETIEYDHTCKQCNHVIARHFYSYTENHEAEIQDYNMSCALCGKGNDSAIMSSAVVVQERTQIVILEEFNAREQAQIAFPSVLISRIPEPPHLTLKDDDDDEWK